MTHRIKPLTWNPLGAGTEEAPEICHSSLHGAMTQQIEPSTSLDDRAEDVFGDWLYSESLGLGV